MLTAVNAAVWPHVPVGRDVRRQTRDTRGLGVRGHAGQQGEERLLITGLQLLAVGETDAPRIALAGPRADHGVLSSIRDPAAPVILRVGRCGEGPRQRDLEVAADRDRGLANAMLAEGVGLGRRRGP